MAKLGFPVPIRLWLREEMYDWARAIITESRTEALLDKNSVLALLDEHPNRPVDRSRQLWTLLVFMLWHAIFIQERITPPDTRTPLPCHRHLTPRQSQHTPRRGRRPVRPATRLKTSSACLAAQGEPRGHTPGHYSGERPDSEDIGSGSVS
ncbi:asparagine synthase-related protein [Nocardia takedensis]